MDEKAILENNINDFHEMAIELKGCAELNAGTREKFACEGCPTVGNCIEYLHMALSIVSDWIADFIAGGDKQFLERTKKIFKEDSEDKEPSDSLYA